jgi:hypothetical protein
VTFVSARGDHPVAHRDFSIADDEDSSLAE